MIPIRVCGYDDVRPVKGKPGEYVCSKCGKVMTQDWVRRNGNNPEVNKRKPIDESTNKA